MSEELQDESGAVKTRKHYYYDDETFAADNPGRISKGNLTLVQEWVDPGSPDQAEASRHRWAERHHYDAFGNVVRSLDPLGVSGRPELGHQRSVELDGVVHSHPVKETVFTANPLVVAQGERAPRLEMAAEYDLAFGVLTRATDFNGNRTQFDFDPFGRLVAITKPGDSPEFPTASFQYQLAEPLAVGGSVNWIETRLREVPGGPGTFDSRKYLDGLGRALMVRTEGERPGEVVVSGATVFNRRRGAWKTLLPYFERGTLAFHSPVLTNDFTETIYDPLGRTVGIHQPATAPNPRRAYARTTYGPLSRLVEDEEQTRDGSVHAGAAMRFTDDGLRGKDGNPRLRQVEEIVKITDDGHSAPDPRPWVTRYRYDLLDNLAHLTDSQGNQKSFRYDALSRKLSMNDPDRGVMFWVYDDASNLVETRDAKQQVIRFNYDGVNRLLAEDYLDLAGHAPDVSYAYDVPTASLSMGDGTTGTARNVQGTLAYVRDLSGEEHTSYDARARIEFRVKQIRDPAHGQLAGFRTGFEYDSLDRITRLTYPDNDHIRYQYNNRNLLERVAGRPAGGQSAGGNIITGIAYQASGQMSSIDYGNGVRTSYAYDPRLRLMELHTRNPSQAADLIHFAYEFDDASNIRAIRDRRSASAVPAGDPRRNTQVFSYDDLYRLTRAGYSFSPPEVEGSENGFISYRYDRIGNMLQQSSDITHLERGVSVTDLGTMAYGGSEGRAGRIGRSTPEPGPHALSSILPSAGSPRLFPYDANGNMTVIDGLTNTWDFKDRLVAVESSEMRAEYGYDYTDRRVIKKVTWKVVSTNNTSGANPGWVLYPDRNFEVREHNAPVKYVWNGDTRVARVTGNLNASDRVQRVILRPGWNVVALAVTLSDGASQFSAGPVQQVLRHGANLGQYSAIRPDEVLPAGTILRVQSSAAVTLGLRGVRSDPAVRTYPAGRHWIANSDFEPLGVATRLPADAPLWFWDAGTQDWRHRFVGLLSVANDHPSSLAPGEAVFAVNASPFVLGLPDPALEIRYYHQDHLGSSSVMSDASGGVVSESAYYPFGQPRQKLHGKTVMSFYQYAQKEFLLPGLSWVEIEFAAEEKDS
ncbi:MAG: RHS repeat protein [Verrucomicrobiales bacterium]|nr:RHS repeat protein [Verrucomicrobiales bacterium]